MKNLEDMFGREIKLGDYVLYSVKESTSVSTHVARVWKITWEHACYSIGVISIGKRWDWNQPAGDRHVFKAYKTVLTTNKTLFKVNALLIPTQVLEVLKEYDR